MARAIIATSYLSTEEVKARLNLYRCPWCRQIWLIIYHAMMKL